MSLNIACLPDAQCVIWQIALSDPNYDVEDLQTRLSVEEMARARRFYFEKDRRNFTLCRSILRLLLAQYLKIAPDALAFYVNRYGKPRVEAACQLFFNVSHSNEYAVMAFTRNDELGIDIEYCRDDIDCLSVAKRYFDEAEYQRLLMCDRAEQLSYFYRLWVCKEAWLKAQGLGLSGSLKSCVVDFKPTQQPYFANIDPEDGAEDENWQLYSLNCPLGYQAAIVSKCEANSIIQYDAAPSVIAEFS